MRCRQQAQLTCNLLSLTLYCMLCTGYNVSIHRSDLIHVVRWFLTLNTSAGEFQPSVVGVAIPEPVLPLFLIAKGREKEPAD